MAARKLDFGAGVRAYKKKPKPKLGIYLITRKNPPFWNETGDFLSAIVIARTATEAKMIHPDGMTPISKAVDAQSWANSPDDVLAERLGDLDPESKRFAGEVLCKDHAD